MEDLESYESNGVDTRAQLARQAVEKATAAGVLDVDAERVRARYFDGQVLGADGFRRGQTLFGRRQRDLGRIVERGVVTGLEVTQPFLEEDGIATTMADPTRLVIEAGHGVTRAGHTVVLRDRVEVDLTQLPILQRLDATFGLDQRPRAPARTQSGVFALVLRPIEFTANPVAPYPREITGERRLEDGDVIEATAVTLAPIASESSLDGVDAGPAALARRVFVDGLDPFVSDNGLPIAVVALERGRIMWLDVEAARRRAAADPGHGFGVGHRSELDAHMGHFARRMEEIVAGLDGGPTVRFAASDYFEVLPPAGQIPVASVTVHGDRLVQWFFPSDVEAELVVVPRDELPGLFEEAIRLGPLDLARGAKTAESSPVTIAIPVARADFADIALTMGSVLRQPIGPRLGSYARRRPVDALLKRYRRPSPLIAAPPALLLQPWADALADADSLFFFRQRRRARTSFSLARHGPIPTEQRPSGGLSEVVRNRIDAAGELGRFDRLLAEAGVEALERLEVLFSRPLFGSDPIFVNGVMAELSSRTRRRLLEPGMVTAGGASVSIAGVPVGAPAPLRVRPLTLEEAEAVAERYESPPELGDGMAGLRGHEGDLGDLDNRLVVAQSLRLPELDKRVLDTRADLRPELAEKVLTLATNNDVNGIRDLVGYVRPEPPPLEVPQRPDDTLSAGFAVADAIGQGALFKILWDHGDDGTRDTLEDLMAHPHARQPLVAGVLMTALILQAWQVDLRGPTDVWLFIEQLYRWPFRPEERFRLPILSPLADVSIDKADPLLSGIFNALDNAGPTLDAIEGAVDLTQASAHLEAQGFPPEGLFAADAYRILGCAFDDVTITKITGDLEAAGDGRFEEYVEELSASVAKRDVEAMRAVLAEWAP